MEELMLMEQLKRGGLLGSMSEHEEMLEKAFKEGCSHGYKKAIRELEGYNERSGKFGGIIGYRTNYREAFEEKIEKLKEKYK